MGIASAEVGLGDVGELVDPGVAEERLEPEDPGVGQRLDLVGVARDEAAEEPAIDPEPPPGGVPLGGQGVGRGRDRVAVERHVDQRRDPPDGGGGRRGREPLPVGPARVVDVDVGIHQARQDEEVAEVLDGHRAAEPVGRADLDDLPALGSGWPPRGRRSGSRPGGSGSPRVSVVMRLSSLDRNRSKRRSGRPVADFPEDSSDIIGPTRSTTRNPQRSGAPSDARRPHRTTPTASRGSA